MIWLRPVDRTSGTLTLSAGTLSCLAHHGTPLSKRCPTTTALERTTVPMDAADRMPPLGAVNPPALWIASKSFCRYARDGELNTFPAPGRADLPDLKAEHSSARWGCLACP